MWNAHRLRNFLGCLCWSTNISLVESSKSAKSSTSPLWLRPGRTARDPPPGHGKGKTASCSPTCQALASGLLPLTVLQTAFVPGSHIGIQTYMATHDTTFVWKKSGNHAHMLWPPRRRLSLVPHANAWGSFSGRDCSWTQSTGLGSWIASTNCSFTSEASTRLASRSGWGGWLRHQEALTASSNPFCGSPQSWVQRFNLACLYGWTWTLAPATNGYSCAGRYLFEQRCRDLWFATKNSPPISHCPFTGGVGCCSPIWIWILRWCRQVRYSISDAAACLLVAWHAACCSYIRYAILCDWEATQGTCDGSSAYASPKKATQASKKTGWRMSDQQRLSVSIRN